MLRPRVEQATFRKQVRRVTSQPSYWLIRVSRQSQPSRPSRCLHTFFRKITTAAAAPNPTRSDGITLASWRAECAKACATYSMSLCSTICATNIYSLKERPASTILVRYPVGARYFYPGEYHPRQTPGRRKIFLSRRVPSSSDPR